LQHFSVNLLKNVVILILKNMFFISFLALTPCFYCFPST
jgi:hypothetical protein